MNKKLITFFSVISLSLSLPLIPATAAVKAGAKCTKAGTKSVVGNKTFTCVKSGKKLIWNKGVLSALPIENTQPVISPTNQKPAIAIIDTAVDTNIVNVFHEVCVMQELRCPNGKAVMSGPGSAYLPWIEPNNAKIDPRAEFNHGTVTSLIASKVGGSDINIVFVRIVPQAQNGAPGYYDAENDLNGALNWVLNNQTKYNIVAVSASLGSRKIGTGPAYCPVRDNLRNSIVNLQKVYVATIMAAGNNYDTQRVDFPACIPESVAVGSVNESGSIEDYSNGGPDLDFYALGTYNTAMGITKGTSAATAAFAAYWAKNYKGSYQATYDYMKSIALSAEGNGIKTNSFVDVLK